MQYHDRTTCTRSTSRPYHMYQVHITTVPHIPGPYHDRTTYTRFISRPYHMYQVHITTVPHIPGSYHDRTTCTGSLSCPYYSIVCGATEQTINGFHKSEQNIIILGQMLPSSQKTATNQLNTTHILVKRHNHINHGHNYVPHTQ